MYLEKDYFLIDFYNERESYGFYTDIDNLNSIVMNIKNEKQKLNYLLTARNYTCPSFFIASSIIRIEVSFFKFKLSYESVINKTFLLIINFTEMIFN